MYVQYQDTKSVDWKNQASRVETLFEKLKNKKVSIIKLSQLQGKIIRRFWYIRKSEIVYLLPNPPPPVYIAND